MSLAAFITLLPPAFWLLAGGILLFITPRILRLPIVIAAPLLVLWQEQLLLGLSGPFPPLRYLRYELMLFHPHDYSHLFTVAFALVALLAGLFAHFVKAGRVELALGYLSAAAACGIVYAGDLITLFLCWEALAVTSLFLIWQGETNASRGAGIRYALVHFLGGMLLLGGIIAHVAATDSTLLTSFHFSAERWLWTSTHYSYDIAASSWAIWMIFAGVLINAGAPPFSAWIADAYPESSASGMPFLSAFTTKAAVFVLLTFFSGTQVLVYLGMFMLAQGMLLAMLENDFRRLLAFATLAQLGVLLVGIGMGGPLAEQGVALHAFNHLIYNALLVILAGVVMVQTQGRHRFTDLGGLSRHMPFTAFCALIGVLSLAGLPGTGGYVGKSFISDAAGQYELGWVYIGLTLAAAVALVYGALRFLWFTFFHPPRIRRGYTEASVPVLLVLGILTASVLLPGSLHAMLLYPLLPAEAEGHPFALSHVVAQLQLLAFSAFAFFFFLPLFRPTTTVTLDTDWFYRRLLAQTVFGLEKLLGLGYTAGMFSVRRLAQFFTTFIIRLTGPGGSFAETRPLANTTLIVAVLLAGYLLLYHYRT